MATENPNPAPASGPQLDTLDDAQLAQWELTGQLPGEPSPELPAENTEEAAASKLVDQAPSTDVDAKAATEAAAPEKVKGKGQKKSAAERAEEIEREITDNEDRLRKALARRRESREALEEAERSEPSRKAEKGGEAAAPTTKAERQAFRDMPGAPKSSEFDTLDEYVEAMGVFIAEKVSEQKAGELYDSRSSAEREANQRDAEFIDVAEKASTRLQAEIDADPGLLDRIDPRWKALNPSDRLAPGEQVTVAHFIKDQATFHSNHPGKLAAWLTENDGAELRRIGRLHPNQIIRELAIKDASFETTTDEPSGDAAGERQHPRISKAPAPSPTLGKKAATARDPRKTPDSFDDFDQWNLEETRATAGKA